MKALNGSSINLNQAEQETGALWKGQINQSKKKMKHLQSETGKHKRYPRHSNEGSGGLRRITLSQIFNFAQPWINTYYFCTRTECLGYLFVFACYTLQMFIHSNKHFLFSLHSKLEHFILEDFILKHLQGLDIPFSFCVL